MFKDAFQSIMPRSVAQFACDIPLQRRLQNLRDIAPRESKEHQVVSLQADV
jgi:hypothetical protein